MHQKHRHSTLCKLVATLTLLLIASLGAQAHAAGSSTDKTLPSHTRFFVPRPESGAIQQAIGLLRQGQLRNALLIAAMEGMPRGIWLVGGTSSAVEAQVSTTLSEAAEEHAVPVFVAYNIPGRDCGSYSAGGAQDTGAYEVWIDAIASAIGNRKVVIILEPDALANLPSDCGYDPTKVNVPQATADRYTQINYAVTTLERGARTLVYLDAGNSAWHSVGDIVTRLMNAGLPQAQGFFSNSSNYHATINESTYDTWISECIAFANNPADGGWRLGHYSWCASQYYSPLGSVDPNNIATWTYTDQWYQQNIGTVLPTTHFIIDTSRNGQGPLNTATYASAPYNQPAWVIQSLTNGSWCSPPGRGVGPRPSANTGNSLLDAYLWIKIPGESDGTCDSQGGARAWDYSIYTQPGWPTDAAGQAIFDPLWGLDDPQAGAWFPQQALDLAQRANPSMF